MRTTLNIDDDVLETARALADARRMSVGEAVSFLMRRGATARLPLRTKNGFYTFSVDARPDRFGPEDVERALDRADAGSTFVTLRK
ncbi:MAG: antitoxin [Acidobacteriota bacterium]